MSEENKNIKKQEIKKELNRLIGKYLPNKIYLENLNNYLYKLFIMNLQDIDIKSEASKIGSISELDEQGFMAAIKTMSIFSARDVMYETLKESFNSVKNQVELIEIRNGIQLDKPSSNPSFRNSTPNMYVTSPDEGNFQIDLSDKNLKVDSDAKSNLIKAISESSRNEEIFGNKSQVRGSQNWSSSDKEFSIGEDSLEEFNMGSKIDHGSSSGDSMPDKSYTSDASNFSDSSYSSVPEVTKDLDY